MPRKKKDITLTDVVNHMDRRFNVLEGRLGGVEKRLGGVENRVGGLEKSMSKLESEVKEGFRKTHYAIDRLCENRTKDLKRMAKTDDRLDRIENDELPAIKSHIGFAP